MKTRSQKVAAIGRLSDELVQHVVCKFTDISTTVCCTGVCALWRRVLPTSFAVTKTVSNCFRDNSEPDWIERYLPKSGENSNPRGDFGRVVFKGIRNQPGASYGPNDPQSGTYSTFTLPASITRIEFSVTMKDQGFGNRKGHYILQLLRGDPDDRASIQCEDNLTPIAEHVYTNHYRIMERTHPLVKASRPGDMLRVLVVVGCGGGHALYTKNFRLLVECHRQNEVEDSSCR